MPFSYPIDAVFTDSGTITIVKPIGDLYQCNTIIDDVIETPCYDCFPTDGQIMYFNTGDVFTYQLNFSPATLSLFNFDGTPIANFNQFIDGNILRIDTSQIPVNISCFYFSAVYNEETYCLKQGFVRYNVGTSSVNPTCGLPTITIESFYSKVDSHGNNYANTGYSNKRRFQAEVEFIGNVEEATIVNGVRTGSKVYNEFQVNILQPLRQDSILLKELVEVIMRGKNPVITISSKFPYETLYCVDFTDSISRTYDSVREWYPSFTVRTLERDALNQCIL